MAKFAEKPIDSPTRQRLQRLVETYPAQVTGIVKQLSTGYYFTGTVRRRPVNGLPLGKNYVEARETIQRLLDGKPLS